MSFEGLRGLLIVVALLISACTTPIQGSRDSQMGEFELALGEQIELEQGRVVLTFVEVVEDSRCPVDVTCVWAGRARVLLAIAEGSEEQQVTLTLGEMREEDARSIKLDGLELSLEAVQPHPLEGQAIDPGEYVITFNLRSVDER